MASNRSQSRRSPGQLGSAEQLPSGRWRAFYRRDGRKFAAPRTFETRADASAWLAGEMADRSRGVWRDPNLGTVTLADYARTWLDSRPELERSTRAQYDAMVDTWIARRVGQLDGSRGVDIGGMPLADISPAVVRTWRAAVLVEARARITARASAPKARDPHPARVWARAQGIAVPDTGKLSALVLEAWQAAGAPRPTVQAAVPPDAGHATAAHAYRALRTIMRAAVTDGQIAANPCQIRGAGQVHSHERPIATPAEVQTIADHMPRRLRAAVLVAAWASLRYGELFALARRHVNLETGELRIERALAPARAGEGTLFKAPKTRKSLRTVNLPRFVLAELAAHLDEFTGSSPDALVFTLENGSHVPLSRVSEAFGKARALAGRPELHWHDLRHTGAALAYKTGASVPEVQRRLGHTTMRAATIYAHVFDESDRVLADRLDDLFAPGIRTAPPLRAV